MKTKHTPDPLPPISCDLDQHVTFPDTDGRTETVVELVNRDAGLTVAYAVPEHAKFIVRACNIHHELLEALQQALFAIPTTHAAFGTIRAAVDKATL